MIKNNKNFTEILSNTYLGNLPNKKTKSIVNKILSMKHKTDQDIDNFISKFNNIKIDDTNISFYIISHNNRFNFNLSPNQIMSIIKKSNLNIQDSDDCTLSMNILQYNKVEKLNLSPNQIISVIESSDLSIQDFNGWTLPMFLLTNNQIANLNLSPEQIMSVLEKSDLSIKDINGWTLPTIIALNNKNQNLNLSPEQIISILEKANTTTQNFFNGTLGMYVIKYNKDQKLNLPIDYIMSTLEKSDISLLKNDFITLFFNQFKNNFDLTNKQLHKTINSFNTNIKGISTKNQDQINKILFHYEIEEKIQKKHNPKQTNKL